LSKPKQSRPIKAARRSRPSQSVQNAVNLFNAGRLSEAKTVLDLALLTQPNDPDALNLVGGIAMREGRIPDAIDAFKRASDGQKRNPLISLNLATAYRRAGNLDEAIACYDKALKLDKNLHDARALKGDALRALGRWAEAEKAYKAVLAAKPGNATALNGLGLFLSARGNTHEARQKLEAATAALPEKDREAHANVLMNIASTYLAEGRILPAIETLRSALDLTPQDTEIAIYLAESLFNVSQVPDGPEFRAMLTRLLSRPDIGPRPLGTVAATALKGDPTFRDGVIAALGGASGPNVPRPDGEQARQALAVAASCELLTTLLRATPIPDADIERALTRLRSALIDLDTAELAALPEAQLDIICALAEQCFINEYVYGLTPAELDAAARQKAALQNDAAHTNWAVAALLACYEPLAGILNDAAPRDDAPAGVLRLIRQQIDEPGIEAELGASIAPVRDKTSLAVKGQYEEHPYPRWTRVGARRSIPFRAAIRRRFFDIDEQALPLTDRPRTLIAGCGTGLETINVIRTLQTASVLAVDLSLPSLAYGKRKLQELSVSSITYRQGDILELGSLGEDFDLIHSFGVLHHMQEPAAGLDVLSGLLAPGGYMFLGLYSHIARGPVRRAREVIAERAIPPNADGIRGFRQSVFQLDDNDPLKPISSPASDFWTMSECRDLMFHEQEHQLTLLQIDRLLGGAGLEFVGIEVQHGADVQRFRAQFPDREAARSLGAWHAFETANPQTFGGTYRIWARKAG